MPHKNQGPKWVKLNYILEEPCQTKKGANFGASMPFGWRSEGPGHGRLQTFWEPNEKSIHQFLATFNFVSTPGNFDIFITTLNKAV